MTKPFENIKVLDLTHVLAGPFCTYQFALLGAEVIKIEPPLNPDCARGRGPDQAQNDALRGLNYQVQASNKKAITLDLKQKAGQDILKKMVANTDIFVENYRTGALDKIGLGYDALKAINPKLIYCSLTGYGNDGPRAYVNAYDNVIQATSGIIDQSSGHKPGVSFVDYAAGYNAAFAISAALHQRAITGHGTYISTSMLEVAMALMAPEAAAAAYPVKIKRDKEAGISAYETKDGIIMIGAFTPEQNNRMWHMFEKFGYEGSVDVKDWQELWNAANEIRAALINILKDKSASEWQQLFHDHNLPAEKQRGLADAIQDEQLAAREYFHIGEKGSGDTHAPTLPVAAYKFEDGPEIKTLPPGFNQHTDQMLSEMGYTQVEIDDLKKQGVIAS